MGLPRPWCPRVDYARERRAVAGRHRRASRTGSAARGLRSARGTTSALIPGGLPAARSPRAAGTLVSSPGPTPRR